MHNFKGTYVSENLVAMKGNGSTALEKRTSLYSELIQYREEQRNPLHFSAPLLILKAWLKTHQKRFTFISMVLMKAREVLPLMSSGYDTVLIPRLVGSEGGS